MCYVFMSVGTCDNPNMRSSSIFLLQVDVPDYDSKTPLHYASISGRDEVFQFLVEKGRVSNIH
jgi:ankyrin repeat protein